MAPFMSSAASTLSSTDSDSESFVDASIQGEDQKGTLITDPDLVQRMQGMMMKSSLDPVIYKGNLVRESSKAVLTHIVEEFKDHVTAFSGPSKIQRGNNREWVCTYKINGVWCKESKYFAIDDIYLDLASTKPGANNVRVLLPTRVYKMLSKIASLDQCPIQGSYVSKEELREVMANFDRGNPPAFVTVREHIAEEGDNLRMVREHLAEEGDNLRMMLNNEGTLTEIIDSGSHKHLYKITGIFTGKSECQRGIGKSTLTLVGLRVFLTHDDILSKDKDVLVNATAFGE